MAPAFGARGVLQDGPAASPQGSPAEQGGGCNRPAGCGRYAHELNRIVVSRQAHVQRVAPRRAGPDHVPPLGGQGAFSKDPGSHNVVSSRLDVCRQPSRIHGGLFLTRGAIDAALNFGLTTRHQPGSDPRRECPERRPVIGSLHAHNMERTNGEIAAVEYAYRRRRA